MSKLRYIYSSFGLLCILFIGYIFDIIYITSKLNSERNAALPAGLWTGWSPSLSIPLVMVVCSSDVTKLGGSAFEEIYVDLKRQKEQIRVMLGTLLYFSNSEKWLVYIVTDIQATFDVVTEGLATAWPKAQYERLAIRRRGIKMPADMAVTNLLHHYRPCAWQKLFLDLIFPDYESLVFMDTDVLFTGPAEYLWNEFSKFNDTQSIGASPEPWYIKENDWPHAGKHGINTGVLSLNLTKLKTLPTGGLGFAIAKVLVDLKKKDPGFDPLHDQDMVNLLLNKYPQFLYEIEFKYNFVPSDCTEYAPPCESCDSDGITIVHGSDVVFYRNVDQRYRILYNVMEKMTRNLTIFPRDLLHTYEGGMEAIESFIYFETTCRRFDRFLSLTTHTLRKMIATSSFAN